MPVLEENRGEINDGTIADIINRDQSDEHLCFSLMSKNRKKGVIVFCQENEARKTARNHFSEFKDLGYEVIVFEISIKQISRLIQSLEFVHPEVIIDFHFEFYLKSLKHRIQTHRFQIENDFQNVKNFVEWTVAQGLSVVWRWGSVGSRRTDELNLKELFK